MRYLRILYIKTTNLTHGYKDRPSKILSFYKLWAPIYDISIRIDPAYHRNLKKMIDATVSQEDYTLDIGCGTGLGTLYAATKARKLLGVDPSKNMLDKFRKKIRNREIDNIELREGFFPQALDTGEKFGSIISSFMFAHLGKEQRTRAIKTMFDILEPGGKVGLFSARGEIAPTFQTRGEIEKNLSSAGFANVTIEDVDDIYRISLAEK